MIELRKDYVLDRWSYIAAGRGKRPKQFGENSNADGSSDICYFCPGNEKLTPLEIGRFGDKEKWEVRWFPNKFPAAEKESDSKISTAENYYTSGGAFGYHEVIAETPDHDKQLADLSSPEIKKVLEAYTARIKDLGSRDNIKYVQIFKNSGIEAGTSLRHSHSQIIATNIIPRAVLQKLEALKKFRSCPYCDIIKREEKSKRFIYSNDDFVVFAAYAPRFNFETCIFPKKHYLNMTELNDGELSKLSDAFHAVLHKLGRIKAPYNFYLHYSPSSENMHFHFEITPRINTWAGFELATDSFVITTSPEDAAEFYRE